MIRKKLDVKFQNKANRNTLKQDLDIRISNKNLENRFNKHIKMHQILKNLVKIIEQKWRITAKKWENLKESNGIIIREK